MQYFTTCTSEECSHTSQQRASDRYDEARAELRNRDREMEEADERHAVEIKVNTSPALPIAVEVLWLAYRSNVVARRSLFEVACWCESILDLDSSGVLSSCHH